MCWKSFVLRNHSRQSAISKFQKRIDCEFLKHGTLMRAFPHKIFKKRNSIKKFMSSNSCFVIWTDVLLSFSEPNKWYIFQTKQGKKFRIKSDYYCKIKLVIHFISQRRKQCKYIQLERETTIYIVNRFRYELQTNVPRIAAILFGSNCWNSFRPFFLFRLLCFPVTVLAIRVSTPNKTRANSFVNAFPSMLLNRWSYAFLRITSPRPTWTFMEWEKSAYSLRQMRIVKGGITAFLLPCH